MVLPFHEDKDSTVYLGVLMCLRHMIPNLDTSNSSKHTMKGLRGSFGSQRSFFGDGLPGDEQIQSNQLLQVDKNVLRFLSISDSLSVEFDEAPGVFIIKGHLQLKKLCTVALVKGLGATKIETVSIRQLI